MGMLVQFLGKKQTEAVGPRLAACIGSRQVGRGGQAAGAYSGRIRVLPGWPADRGLANSEPRHLAVEPPGPIRTLSWWAPRHEGDARA
jgi:hypothetical protein